MVISEGASVLPVARELLDARERAAGALTAAGCVVRTESMRSIRRAMEYYLATLALGRGPGRVDDGERRPRRAAEAAHDRARGAPRARRSHAAARCSCCSARSSTRARREARTRKAIEAGRALAREVEDVIGDGVLLHPPFPRVAPKHGRTVGRPVDDPAGGRVQPDGPAGHRRSRSASTRDGLPLGVQAVAGRDRDHVSIAVAIELERVFGGWVPPR